MTKNITMQEILLITASSFAQRELCENDFSTANNSSSGSQADKLEEACWNGLLEDLLKGAIASDRGRNYFSGRFRWQILFYVSNCPGHLQL